MSQILCRAGLSPLALKKDGRAQVKCNIKPEAIRLIIIILLESELYIRDEFASIFILDIYNANLKFFMNMWIFLDTWRGTWGWNAHFGAFVVSDQIIRRRAGVWLALQFRHDWALFSACRQTGRALVAATSFRIPLSAWWSSSSLISRSKKRDLQTMLLVPPWLMFTELCRAVSSEKMVFLWRCWWSYKVPWSTTDCRWRIRNNEILWRRSTCQWKNSWCPIL